MSRSYKKTPYSGDKKDRFYKNAANRKIRRSKEDQPDGKGYRKHFCSYIIWDCWDIMTEKEWLEWRGKDYDSEEEALIEYRKWYKRK